MILESGTIHAVVKQQYNELEIAYEIFYPVGLNVVVQRQNVHILLNPENVQQFGIQSDRIL